MNGMIWEGRAGKWGPLGGRGGPAQRITASVGGRRGGAVSGEFWAVEDEAESGRGEAGGRGWTSSKIEIRLNGQDRTFYIIM